ncbi:MAG: NAD(P)-binding domain-containing protein [Rubrobacteraceae bacterium]|nr:NAD(P)-binding domain-containing protein [Rubrobacteraceae bacterium]
MRVGIIGAGRIGGNAGRLFVRAGHEVLLSFSRDHAKLEALAAEAGNGAVAGTPAEAARFGEVVMLSVPWGLVDEALGAAGPLDGKILIDTTNQFGRDESGNFGVLDLPDGLSAAAYNARRAGGARLVKAYNTMTSGFQAEAAGRAGLDRVVMFYGGDDDEANRVVAGLIDDSGFDPVYVGSLTGDVVWMEPPRREGALYGEEFHLQEARETVARLTDR